MLEALTPSMFRILNRLREPQTVSSIHHSLGISRNTIRSSFTRLMLLGLVIREEVPPIHKGRGALPMYRYHAVPGVLEKFDHEVCPTFGKPPPSRA